MIKGLRCDSCQKEIRTVSEAYLEWYTVRNALGPIKPRIVHNILQNGKSCHYDTYIKDSQGEKIEAGMHLDYFANGGLMRLLNLLSETESDEARDDMIEIIKRVHVENYELCRLYIEEAIAEGVISPNMKDGFYHPSNLLDVVRHFNLD